MARLAVRGKCPNCGGDLLECASGTQVVCADLDCSYYERLAPDGSRVELKVKRRKK